MGFPIPRRTLEFSEFGWGSEVVKPLVNTTGLCKHYCVGDSVVHAISAISVTIDQGEFVAISGRSGSGKSTLMNLFGLLERPDAGQYFLNGIDVAKLSGRSRTSIRNQQIGFVFQLPTFLPRSSALENVALPLSYAGIHGSARRRKAKDALDRVGLKSSAAPLVQSALWRGATACCHRARPCKQSGTSSGRRADGGTRQQYQRRNPVAVPRTSSRGLHDHSRHPCSGCRGARRAPHHSPRRPYRRGQFLPEAGATA